MERWALFDDQTEHEVSDETNAEDDQIEDDIEVAETDIIHKIVGKAKCEIGVQFYYSLSNQRLGCPVMKPLLSLR